MKMTMAFLLIFLCCHAYPQESVIKIDSGNKNDIQVVQSGNAPLKKSQITLDKAGANTIKVNQQHALASETPQKEKQGGFNEWISNTNNVFVLLISMATFIGLLWKGWPYAKKWVTRTKLLTWLFLATAAVGMAQTSKPQSSINIKGSNNSIKVVQGHNVVVYNLDDEKQYQQFLTYLQTLPGIQSDIKNILRFQKKTYELVNKASEEGILNPQSFTKIIDGYIRENERLKTENEQLRKQTTDVDFATVLQEAGKKLAMYDNAGYEQILENFKTQ
jgi:hypothetical protein